MIVTDEVRSYLEELHAPADPVLQRMREHGNREGIPIVHAITGVLLETIASARLACRAVEVGTAIGVSTLHLARGGAHVTSFEIDPERHAAAARYIEEAGCSEKVDLRLQDATEGLKQLEGVFDIAFIDGPKEGYGEHLELVTGLLRHGGVLIVDNSLMSGSVATGEPTGPWTKERVEMMRVFNRRLLDDPRFVSAAVLPVGDGIAIATRR